MTGNKLITEFKKQNRDTIWQHLESLASDRKVYSDSMKGIHPYLRNNTLFIYAAHKSLVVVCLDNCPTKEELADEEPFNLEDPLYFSENSHRVSPVWQLSETINLIRKKMAEGRNNWPILGVLLTESTIINAKDMQDVWDEMDVKVIDRADLDVEQTFATHPDEELVFGTMIMSLLRELDEEKRPKESSVGKEEDEFAAMLEKFLNDDSGNKKKEVEKDEEEDDDEEDEMEEKETPFGSDSSDIGLPSGIIEQNNNVSVKVKVLPPLANPRKELDKLVGCQEIKKRMDELLALTRYNKMVHDAFPNAKQHEVSLHSIFFGRPGTGKTTVCKIFGSLLHEAGALSKGHVLVTDRGTFIGTLWGDEERSVRQVLEMAQGGVLMIDEAYLLNSKHENDPGRIAIQMLMEVLADEKQRDIAVVLCGYKEPMMQLLDTNPGLHSRFPNRFEFNDFTVDELMEITRRRIGEYQYRLTRQAWQKYKDMLTAAYQMRDPQSWGNARFVSNQLERIFIQHAQRCVKQQPADGQRLLTITPADITPIDVPRPKPRIGF